jgi:hypothetical protein
MPDFDLDQSLKEMAPTLRIGASQLDFRNERRVADASVGTFDSPAVVSGKFKGHAH